MTSVKRLYQLDLIRFLAALYVVFYHYCFRGYNKDDFSPLAFEGFEFLAKYGYLGVDLFFIISGFVILLSTINSNIVSFVISRVSRLYPAYWVSVILTVIFLLVFGSGRFSLPLPEVLANLTMFNGFFGIPYVDGVYWSLLVELKFYFFIGFLLLFNKTRYLMHCIYIWLAVSTYYLIASQFDWNLSLSIISYFMIPRWASYFIAGMLFFMIRTDGKIKSRILPLMYCLVLSLCFAHLKVDLLNIDYGGVFDHYVVYGLVISFYVLFFLFSTDKLEFLNRPIFYKLGIMTYPLYLIHQNIGYTIFQNLNPYLNKYVILLGTILVMLIVSYLISDKIEKPFRKFLIRRMKESKLTERVMRILGLNQLKY